MKLKLIVPLLITVLLGCGQVDEQSVYDIADNPDQFPAAAIGLLVNLENGQFVGSEAITYAFGNLYTQHSELLDNQDWKVVIERLGGRFGQTADSLKDHGVGSYTDAAEYYQLGSFARPDDPNLRKQAALFATWLTGVQDTAVNLSFLTGTNAPALADIVSASRYFLEADPLHREFFEAYLSEAVKVSAGTHDLVRPEALAQLTPTDRTLLVAAGLIDE